MAAPRKRFDAYARPLPHLADTPRRHPIDATFNRQQQALIETLLAQVYADLLVPGMHAEVCLMFTIHDGTISRDIYTDRREQHHVPEEER